MVRPLAKASKLDVPTKTILHVGLYADDTSSIADFQHKLKSVLNVVVEITGKIYIPKREEDRIHRCIKENISLVVYNAASSR